ncbi:hypothetical protein O181_110332 [Austropuccinia psidii MF-1]|uniref:Uncharacterized protein n=1 Tax=Austropuccinia psidii MF-1 TaxID=1389203 RepID=A0A9Q3JZK2_9BASI|nr:hypothetical protein [Austropuccinia psidii MF-1]
MNTLTPDGWLLQGLEGYLSSSAAPPTTQRPLSMEHGQQEVKPSIPLGRTCSKLSVNMSQRDRLQRPYGNQQRHRRTDDTDRAYSYSFRLTRVRPNQLSSGFTPFRNQQISGQDLPFITIPGIFQQNTRIQGQKQDLFQQKAERVRPNDPEPVGLGERSTQEPEIFVHTSRISITDYWITDRLNTAFKGHASIWYTEMEEIHGRRSWPWWRSQTIKKNSNGPWVWQKTMSFENDKHSVDKDPYEWCLRQSKRLKANDPQMNIQMTNHKLLKQMPGELENAVKFR